jgi:hypothetical protein
MCVTSIVMDVMQIRQADAIREIWHFASRPKALLP